jgi:hypothetical protein
MAAVIEKKVIFIVPIVHRDILCWKQISKVTDEQEYAKVYAPFFYEDPTVLSAHIFTDKNETNTCRERLGEPGDNILHDLNEPSRVIFDDQLLLFRRTVTVTHQVKQPA